MTLQEILLTAGFSSTEAARLADSVWFKKRHINKSAEEIAEKILSISIVYGVSAVKIRAAVITHPQFAVLDHQRVIKGVMETYGCDSAKAAKAIFTHPPFVGLDHQRVTRQLTRIGRKVGLDSDIIKEKILSKPILADFSAKRYLAVIDVFGHMETSYQIPNYILFDLWIKRASKSPYVPETERLRISQVQRSGIHKENPPLTGALTAALRKQSILLKILA